jgi:GAF domain-containing protein
MLSKQVLQFAPVLGNPAAPSATQQFARELGFNAVIYAPMIRDDKVIGAIGTVRDGAEPFNDKQIALIKAFADQAVIAIENVRLFDEVQARTRELSDALHQQTATADVLKVISHSRFELQPVFDTVLENAVRLCEAERSFIFLFDGKVLRAAASYNTSPELREFIERNPIAPGRNSAAARAALERRTVHIPDVQADPEYTWGVGQVEPLRTLLGVPMLKGDELVGVIVTQKRQVKPFTDKQIALVEAFAAQAVIAIENARLLNELRESLTQQTATSDVLKVISRSTFDLQRVLDTLVESAARLCNAYDAVVLLRERESLVFRAHHGPIPIDFVELPITRATTAGRAVLERKPVHVRDITAERDEFPEAHALAVRQGHRAILSVPLLREDEAIGSLVVRRIEARAFSTKQIELAATFADQAVIAIENVRLFDEVQARTRELSESLEQQTATAEVLRVISSSPSELEPVFQAILANATRICEANFGTLFKFDDGGLMVEAGVGIPQPLADYLKRRQKFKPLAGSTLEHLVKTRQVVHVHDVTQADGLGSPSAKLGRARTYIGVPMLKENMLVGAIAIYRQEVRPFTDKQIELVQNFAAQAVIAIENTRLLNELRESLQQQTATSEVLQVISSSPGELQPVLMRINLGCASPTV